MVADKPLAPDRWHHVFVTYDGSAKPAGVKIYVDGTVQSAKAEQNSLDATIQTHVPLPWAAQPRQPWPRPGTSVQDVRVYGRTLSDEEVKLLGTDEAVRSIVASGSEKLRRRAGEDGPGAVTCSERRLEYARHRRRWRTDQGGAGGDPQAQPCRRW